MTHRNIIAAGVLALGMATSLAAQQPAGQQPSGPAAALRDVRPLSLEEALRLAVDASETVGIARAGVERARGEHTRARSEFFPQLNASADYVRTIESQFRTIQTGDGGVDTGPSTCPRFFARPGLPIDQRVDSLEREVQCLAALDPLAGFSSLPFGRPNQWSFGLSASQILFAGGRVLAQTRAAAAGRRRAEIELTAQNAQLVLDVTTAYYDAALSDRLLAIAEASLEQSGRTLRDVQLALQVGTQPEFEVLRARVARDNQRPVVIQRRTAREIAYIRLAQLLNLPLEQPLALSTSLGDTTDTEPPALPVAAAAAGAPDTAVVVRAPVRQAAEDVTAAENQLRAARAGSFPAVRLSSEFAKINYPSGMLPGDRYLTDWTVSVGVDLPLFTGGRLKGERMTARAGLEQAELRRRQTAEQAIIDTRNTLATLDAAQAQWEASTGTVTQARRAYEIAEVRYREGISTQTELSDARLQLQDAQANRAQAARDLQVARTRVALLRDLPLAGAGTAAFTGGAAGASTGGGAGITPGAPVVPSGPSPVTQASARAGVVGR